MSFRYLPEIVIADVAFEARGNNLNELFEECALATEEVMVDTKGLKLKTKKEIKVSGNSVDNLLFDFLSELLYYKDAEGLLFGKFKVDVKKVKSEYVLKAIVEGEKRDPKRHELRSDVKAITLHMWYLKREKGGAWRARIVEDI